MKKVLLVDLDGSLINTDTTWELFIRLVKNSFIRSLVSLTKLLSSRANFKAYLAENSNIDVATLPYNKPLLQWLTQQKQKGQTLILTTASNQKIAQNIADHLKIFDDVLASTKSNQLTASNKLLQIKKIYQEKHFDYVGNHKKDLAIWQCADQAIVVNASNRVLKKAKNIANVTQVFPRKKLTVSKFLKAIRVHQYVKNLLIFIPYLLSLQFEKTAVLANCIGAFIAFSLLASSIYVINDLLDLQADRLHHRKQHRAFATGLISIPAAILLTVLLLISALLIALHLPLNFLLVLIGYYVITNLYSFYLKQKPLIDVYTLAGLYTIRIIAGMTLVGGGYSEWLILFSIFFFLSLAFIKRYVELETLIKNNGAKTVRGYHTQHSQLIRIFGITSGYISSLVIALYLNSSKAITMYNHPQLLWFISVINLYWISRVWLLAGEHKLHDDPIVFALTDKTSYYLIFIVCCTIFLAVMA